MRVSMQGAGHVSKVFGPGCGNKGLRMYTALRGAAAMRMRMSGMDGQFSRLMIERRKQVINIPTVRFLYP